MASRKIKWPKDAILSRRSNSTCYSRFTAISKEGETTSYSIGECVTLKVHRRVAVMLGEIIELCVEDLDSDEEGAEFRERVKMRLYAYPQDTPTGINHTHGEHELVMFYKHVILTCKQFLTMEQPATDWGHGIPLRPPPDPALPPSPAPSNRSSTSSVTGILYCYEPMVPVGLFEYEDQKGTSPCPSPIANRTTPTSAQSKKVKVVSYLTYCRYRAVLARFEGSSAYQFMSSPLVKCVGGLPVPCVPTLMMFCRKTFRDITLERKLNFCISKEVTHSISDRRPSSSLSPSSPSTTSSDNPPTRPLLYKTRGRPPKRRRGRPRKDGSDIVRENDVFYDVPVMDVVCSDSLRRRRVSPYNQDHLPSCKRSRNEVTPKKNNGVRKEEGEEEEGDEEAPIGTTRKRTNCLLTNGCIPSPKKYTTTQNSLSLTNTANSSVLMDGKLLDPSLTDHTHSAIGISSSGTSLVDSETLVHSLRPRSSLLPPSQFRDEIYDMESSDQSLRSSSSSNDPVTISNSVPLNSNNSTTLSTETVRPVTVTTPHPLGTYKKSTSSIPAVTISDDEKELLKAYLACLQTTTTAGHSPSKETVVQSEGGQPQPDERRFLDLLFSFMKMRRTPIHRVPRLGSRNLNLFDLFKITISLGGYEQVTIDRKWSYVFDTLGCAAGMTCASTVTRKHYEKLLLPFERALAAARKCV